MEPEFDIPCYYYADSPRQTPGSLFADELERGEMDTDIEGLVSQLGDTDLDDGPINHDAVGFDQLTSARVSFRGVVSYTRRAGPSAGGNWLLHHK